MVQLEVLSLTYQAQLIMNTNESLQWVILDKGNQ